MYARKSLSVAVLVCTMQLATADTLPQPYSPFVFVQRMFLIDESPGVAAVEGWGVAYRLLTYDNETCVPRVVIDAAMLDPPHADSTYVSTYVTFTYEYENMLINGRRTISPKVAMQFLGEPLAVLLFEKDDITCDDYVGAPVTYPTIPAGEKPFTWVLHARTRMENNTLHSVRPLQDDEVSRDVFGAFLPIKPDVALMHGHGSPFVLTNESASKNYGYGVLNTANTPTLVSELLPSPINAARSLISTLPSR